MKKRFSILLHRFIHRFRKGLVRHNFPAAKLLAETYTQLIPKLPETLHYFYDPNWFPQNFITVTEVTSENIQKWSINHNKIEIKIYNAEDQLFTCTDIPQNTNISIYLLKHHR